MSDTEVVTLPVPHAGQLHHREANEIAPRAPRIIQYVNAETADNLLVLCGGKSRPALSVVALDDQGHTWSLDQIPKDSQVETERGRLIWRRLWVPPLPTGSDND